MGTWTTQHWESDVASGVPRRDRRSGSFDAYVPNELGDHPLALGHALSADIAAAERAVGSLDLPGAEVLGSVAHFLLRSEAIASSRIEGVAPSPQQVALAELSSHESVRGVSDQARLVANNMTVVQQASSDLVVAEPVTVDHVVALHRALLPDEPRHHGLRTVQNWIGGSDWHPLGADFVPPPPHDVPRLLQDLVDYLNGAAHAAVVQAAVVHAQFETIHPFTDGNGRVGRALIHTVLARRRLTTTAVLPVSLVLATLRDRYVGGLTAYRYEGGAASAAASSGLREWISTFTAAAHQAATTSAELLSELRTLQDEWRARVTEARTLAGVRPAPRSDSATTRLLALLPGAPVVTVATVRRLLGVSSPAAAAALDELRRADVVQTRAVERGATAYLAREVLDLVTLTERRLASTKFDTRLRPPRRGVPAPPQDGPR